MILKCFIEFYLIFMVGIFLLVKNINAANRIVCEYGSWSVFNNGDAKLLPENIDPKLCTHLNYNFINISSEFELMFASSIDILNFKRIIGLKAINPNLKIMCSVGGWNQGTLIFSIIANNATSRDIFSQSVLDFLLDNDCDGINIAWLHPGQRDGIPTDKLAYALLLMDLRAKLAPFNYLISIFAGGIKKLVDDGYEVPIIVNAVDYINLLSFDLKGIRDGITGNPAQLYPHQTDPASLLAANQDSIVNYWISLGAPKSKLNLGIPFFGRTFTLLNPRLRTPGSPISGPGTPGPLTNDPYYLSYPEICSRIKNSSWIKSSLDSKLQAPYAFGPNSKGDIEWIGYSDINSMLMDASYVNSKGLGGVTVWSLENDDFTGKYCNQGTYPLLATLNKVFGIYETNSTEFTVKSDYGHCVCENDIDFYSNDLLGIYTSSNEGCCKSCYENPSCQSFSFVSSSQSCWLKPSINPTRIRSSGRISCRILSRSPNKLTDVPLKTTTTTTTKPTSTTPSTTTTTTTKKPNTTPAKINPIKTSCSLLQNQLNYPGSDIKSFSASNTDECCANCNKMFGCNGWTFNINSKLCYLKSNMSKSPILDSNFISGFPSFASYICRSGLTLIADSLNNCTSFFLCSIDNFDKLRAESLDCPEGLLFNSQNNQCDYPSKVKCI